MPKDSIRKTRSDGDKTKERILKVTLALFAKHGFAETENKEIAKKAKVDIASINYHFGSRKGLFEAVLIRAHQNLVSLEALEAIQRSDMTPEEKLRGVFNLITGAARRGERASLQVISRSVIAPGAALETLFKEEARPKLQVILQIVSEITGFPVGDPRLIHCIASAIAPAFLFFVFGSRFPGPFGALTKMPQSELDDRLTVFALGGLRATAAAAAAKATDEKEKATLPAGSFKVPDTANVA